MKLSNDRTRADKAGAPRQRPRFRIDKLEERIAPKSGGNTKHCQTAFCGETGNGTSY
jgi:hypothetical protein